MNDQFSRIGARVCVEPMSLQRGGRPDCPVIVEVGLDGEGEFFIIQLNPCCDVRLEVTELRVDEGDLVLEAIDAGSDEVVARILCRRSDSGLSVHAGGTPDASRSLSAWVEQVDAQRLSLLLKIRAADAIDADDAEPSIPHWSIGAGSAGFEGALAYGPLVLFS